jgi:hypothetical protein
MTMEKLLLVWSRNSQQRLIDSRSYPVFSKSAGLVMSRLSRQILKLSMERNSICVGD